MKPGSLQQSCSVDLRSGSSTFLTDYCAFSISIVLGIVLTILAVSSPVSAQSSFLKTAETEKLEQLLFDLPNVRFERVKDSGRYPTYMLNVRQPINHEDETAGSFYQQVMLVHRGFDAPTVINTNGYTLERGMNELVGLFKSNLVSVEHRYFGPSTPAEKDWKHLTIQQAAADYHQIRILLGSLYKNHWISTGISKGGETCTYYKYYFPDDVSVTVPYVAPFPIGLKDQRFYDFFEKAGTAECRQKIFDYQIAVLKNKKILVPRLKYFLKGKNATVDLIGGPEAALELFVLEYPFSFWQSGKQSENIPAADADPEVLLDHLIDSGDFWYLLDESTENLAAHYYQHATQLGYYGYQTERFGELIQKWQGELSACFFPYDQNLPFDESLRGELIDWLKSDASDMVFIYGATDTWTVAQAEIGDNERVHKFILPGKHHGDARILQADKETREKIVELIQQRLR